MLVRDLIPLLDAELIYGSDDIDIREIHSGCGSDMMSDVLAFVKDQPVLRQACATRRLSAPLR